jgi:hypothetical protein
MLDVGLKERAEIERGKRGGRTKEKGRMGQLDYQAMPSLVTNVCVHLLYNSSWKFHQLADAWETPVRATGTVWKRQAVQPVHHVQNHTSWVTLLQPARRADVLSQPYSLRPHWILIYTATKIPFMYSFLGIARPQP